MIWKRVAATVLELPIMALDKVAHLFGHCLYFTLGRFDARWGRWGAVIYWIAEYSYFWCKPGRNDGGSDKPGAEGP